MMKTYNVYVNGKAYVVEIEEVGAAPAVPAPTPAPTPAAVTPPPAPAPAAAPAPKAAPAGGITVASPLPGTVISVLVKPGESVKAGQILLILEAMKMENEILAPEDGVVSSIVSQGAAVNTGDVLATL